MKKDNLLSDRDPIPFGKYAGEALANVPAGYLKFFYTEKYSWLKANYPKVLKYISDNMDAIDLEIERGN